MSLQPANMFGNYMVLQRNKPLKVWGTATKGTTITIEIQGSTYEKEVDRDGNWLVTVESLNASENETMVITDGKEVIRYTNVAIGEVWLAGGQSNMEFFMRYDKDFNETVKNCENKNIRFFDYPVITTEHDLDIKEDSAFGFWRPCNEEHLQYYSAVAYYFAKNLQESLDVPVGIIGCNCGGTRACCWMDEESVKENGQVWLDDYLNGIAAVQDLKKAEEAYYSNKLPDNASPFHAFNDKLMYGLPIEELKEMYKNFQESGASQLIGPWHEWRPSGLYHTMLKKVMPYTIKGVIWYQGESDEFHPEIYADMMCAVIRCWRRDWKDEFPFIMSQLAPLGVEIGDGGKTYPILREQQEEVTRRMENVFCASIGDVGSTYDIHPKEKQPIGKRMALLARGHVYGEDILCDAPVPVKSERSQKEITITFIHADNGLKIKGLEVQALKIYNHEHEIMEESLYKISVVNNKLIIHFNEKITHESVEIAFAQDPFYEVNLYNMADIPVKPFVVVILDPDQPIAVTGGKITGTLSADKKVAEFKGIPFAAAPIGDLRWKAPQVVKPWSEVKKCTKFSANATQHPPDYSQPWMQVFTDEFMCDDALGYSEDCLYLNVWTKVISAVKKRPVIVYIHGGGFGSGSGSIPIYAGELLASKDIVYVTINYRLGIFGFLADAKLSAESKDNISGNYGILDQIAALEWVQKNIDKFGGDPSNVTIIGQSAGAASVDILTISPYAKGLFKNAVALSWTYVNYQGFMNMYTLENKQANDSKLLKGKTLEEMRTMTAEALLELPFSNTPCIDGKVIPSDITTVLKKGTQNDVNMISGNVTGDIGLFETLSIGNSFIPITSLSKADYEKAVSEKFGDCAKECLAAYPVTSEDAISQYKQINLDGMIVNQYYFAKLRALKSSKSTYIYSFDHSLPGQTDFGAFHTADIPYWLGVLSANRSAYWTSVDDALRNKMVSYLVDFARSGNPNGKNLEKWNAYDGSMTYFYIGDDTYRTKGFSNEKIQFWQAYYNA